MTRRMQPALFALVCLLGAAAATVLAIAEALHTPAVVVSVVDKARTGLTTAVTVSVHNTTGRARCTVVRVTARDRNGNDLGNPGASGPVQLTDHARTRVVVAVTLTRTQYDEKLYRFVPSTSGCPIGDGG